LGVGATGVGQTLQAHRATLEKVAAVVIIVFRRSVRSSPPRR